MIARAASVLMIAAWTISKLHHFQVHWHTHTRKWEAAQLLLESEVCTRPHLRMNLREFDNCAAAEDYIRIKPFSRAVYSIAEEMHICGNDRCAILYMDITDRLPYIFTLLIMLMVLLSYKLARDYRHSTLIEQSRAMHLPRHHTLKND